MIQRRIPIGVLLLALCPAARVLGQENAQHLPPGREVREHKLLSFGSTDVWSFDAEADEMFFCRVQSDAFDPVLQMVDAGGDVVEEVDGEGTQSEIWTAASRAGAFEFRVAGFEGRGGGSYSFYLERFQASPLPSDGVGTHRFGVEGWWHYRVGMRAGEVLVPVVVGGAGRVSKVFDLERQDLDEDLGGYRAKRDGDVFVRIEGRHREECTLRLQLARCEAFAVAVDEDSDAEARRIEVPAYGLDRWRMQLVGGCAYALALDMPGAQLEFDLRECGRGPGEGAEGPAFVWTGSLHRGGRHRRWWMARRHCEVELVLRHRGGGPMAYTMAVRAPGAKLALDAPVDAELALAGGAVYELPAARGQLLRVSLQSSTFDGQVNLWGPDGTVLLRCDDAGPTAPDPCFTYFVTRPGVHRLLVFSPGARGAGRYRLAVEALPVPELSLGAPPAEFGWRAGAERHAFVRLEKGSEVWLSARSDDTPLVVSVLRPGGRPLERLSGVGIGENVLAAYVAKESGRHTVVLSSAKGAGRCRLRLLTP